MAARWRRDWKSACARACVGVGVGGCCVVRAPRLVSCFWDECSTRSRGQANKYLLCTVSHSCTGCRQVALPVEVATWLQRAESANVRGSARLSLLFIVCSQARAKPEDKGVVMYGRSNKESEGVAGYDPTTAITSMHSKQVTGWRDKGSKGKDQQ